jgi:hypothetical protein
MNIQTYNITMLILTALIPIGFVVGFYIALKIDIAKLQVYVSTLIKDVSEIKTDIKEICKPKN